jgi:SNF2 family DNA or RNA helicase
MLKTSSSIPEFLPRRKPYAHQDREFKSSRNMEYYAFFWEMGLGKTKIIIDTASWLFMTRKIDGVLVLAPKGVFLNWITDELPTHIPENIPYRMAYWNADMKKSDIPACQKLLTAVDDTLDFLVINTEAMATEKGFMVAENFIKNHHTMLVVDESVSIKNPTASRTKAIQSLGAKCKFRRIADGTPITQSPLDLYAQCELLKPRVMRFPSFLQFKAYYAIIRRMTAGTRSFDKIIGYRNLEELTETIKPFTSRLLKEECLDLPEKIYITRYVEQTKAQEVAYERLKEEAMLCLDSGSIVSSTSVLTTMMKLHQINCGHVTDDDGNIQLIESNRISTLLDVVAEIPNTENIIIWAHFQQDIKMICEALNKEYGQGAAVHYYGNTSSSQRTEHIKQFKTNEHCRFFVASSAGARGLTLVGSCYSIYYSQDYNLGVRLQSEDRNHRIGQTRNVTYIDLIIPKTVDDKIVKALRAKKSLADEVLDDPRSVLL